MKRVLAIDGGGIKGVFPASFLAALEQTLNLDNVGSYFDLIVGTSTGGIIALALGLGLSGQDILSFYEQHGPAIFCGSRRLRGYRSWFRSKYDPLPLRSALQTVFGEKRLGDSSRRLVIPSLDIAKGEVHIWKTAHHPRFQTDYRASAVDVAMATAAAPTYFPTHRLASGIPLVDGGTWANNPVAIGVVEAIGILGWAPAELRVLSLGCTSTPLKFDWSRPQSLGKLGWALKIVDVFMIGQSSGAMGMAQHLVPDRENIVRVSPVVGPQFALDDARMISTLKGLGSSEARQWLPKLEAKFFECKANDFVSLAGSTPASDAISKR
jgi:uncharacterized protein